MNKSRRVTRLKEPVAKIVQPFQEFVHQESAGGILLLLCSVAALVWANSPWAESYEEFWHTPLTLQLGAATLEYSLQHWINDGLMVIFFLLVGLEIKRELLVGELSSPRRAALPIAAALGGMLAPAAIYLVMNYGTAGLRGWGVPMATDIAFALGVLALVPNVPIGLKVFLTALAIVDDLGAILVIALFYSEEISWPHLGMAAALIAGLYATNRAGVQKPLAYILPGVLLWYAFLQSGVHATIAGVALAMTIPLASRIHGREFLSRSKWLLAEFEKTGGTREEAMNEREQEVILSLEETCEDLMTPLSRIEHELHPWVSFLIIPAFALANAGVSISADSISSVVSPIGLGIILGLVAGKQIGITVFSWLAVRAGFAELPEGATWKALYGVSWIAGIGFTMSLFVANLAFGEVQEMMNTAKLAILSASILAGVTGWVILRQTIAHSRDSV